MQAITPQEVNAYLPKGKWQVSVSGDFSEPKLEENAKAQVLGKLASVYPVADWRTNEAPKLVRQIIAMYMAAWIYARQFGEDTANINSYASWLLRQAQDLVSSIVSGTLLLEEVTWVDVGTADDLLESGAPIFTTGRVF